MCGSDKGRSEQKKGNRVKWKTFIKHFVFFTLMMIIIRKNTTRLPQSGIDSSREK